MDKTQNTFFNGLIVYMYTADHWSLNQYTKARFFSTIGFRNSKRMRNVARVPWLFMSSAANSCYNSKHVSNDYFYCDIGISMQFSSRWVQLNIDKTAYDAFCMSSALTANFLIIFWPYLEKYLRFCWLDPIGTFMRVCLNLMFMYIV